VERLIMLVRFKDQMTAPEGDPPQFTVHGESEEISVLEGDPALAPSEAAFDTNVRVTGETSFDEDGVITFGKGGDRVRVTTLGEGTLRPSPEEGVHEGSVIWQIEEGEGRLAGATGLITSNFRVWMESGAVTEHQVIALSLREAG
jgi:hypothetical protein